jgi:uncharacterized protein (DUF58 family)
MGNRARILAYIIFTLFVVGILAQLWNNPKGLIIPLIVFGVVLYLYKFPPNRKFSRPKSRKRPAKFRVIQGKQAADKQDDDFPRYH